MPEVFGMFTNPIKFLFIIFVSFSFVSCPNKRPDIKVSPGKAQLRKTFFKKSCSAGSVEIFQKTTGGTVSVSRLNQVNPGDKVSIKGRATNVPTCSLGSLSFICEAQVSIGGAFVCVSGSVSSINSSVTSRTYSRQTQYPTYGTVSTASKTFRGGGVVVHDNGARFSVHISINTPSAYCPQCYCPINFTCQ